MILQFFAIFWLPSMMAICPDGTYINLCGVCVTGHETDGGGMDMCGVCGGDNSTCLGCDGILYSNYTLDLCQRCLPADHPNRDDCVRIMTVYPNVIDQAFKYNTMAVRVRGAGLHAHTSSLNSLKCSIMPMENQLEGPSILELGLEESDLELKLNVRAASRGKYQVSCIDVKGSATFSIVNSTAWRVTSLTPPVLHVDRTYQMKMSVAGGEIGVGDVWCVLHCDDLPHRALPARWLPSPGDASVECEDVTPRQAAECVAALTASQDAAEDPEVLGGVWKVDVASTAPLVTSAELSADLSKLLIRFNNNIQLTSQCSGVFSESTSASLNTSECAVAGNVIGVGLRAEHPLLAVVSIIKGNGLRRMGSAKDHLAPECLPVSVPVSSYKVLPPNLSMEVPSIMSLCGGATDNNARLTVKSIGSQRVKYEWSVPPPQVPPGSQRHNLLLWQQSRLLQAQLNHPPGTGNTPYISPLQLMEDAPYHINLQGTNALGSEQSVTSSMVFSPQAPLSVTVTAPPGVTALTAELHVTQCVPRILTLKWFINGEQYPGAGRIILIGRLQPGTYNISCVVSAYDTNQHLATGWVMTQVLPSDEVALVSPAKQVVGTHDDVVLTLLSLYHVAAVWRCTTENGEPCYAPGPQRQKVEDLIENNVATLIVPAGLMPVGRYVWRVEGMECTEGVVVVRGGTPPMLLVTPVPPLVNPAQPLMVKSVARRLVNHCTLSWSTVFRLGYNFFDLQQDVGLGDPLSISSDDEANAELPLMIPTSNSNWTGLMEETSYLLRLDAVCPPPVGSVHVHVPITVNVPPDVSPISADATECVGLVSVVTISGGEAWEVMGDYPLQYVWTVSTTSGLLYTVSITATARPMVLRLPPGDLTAILQVCDLHRTCTKVTTKIMVTLPSSVPDNLISMVQRDIVALMLEGSGIESLGRAVTAVQTLKAMSGSKAERQLRALMDTVDDAITTRCRDIKLEMESWSRGAIIGLEYLREVLVYLPNLSVSQLTRDVIVELKDALTAASAASTTHRRKRAASDPPDTYETIKVAWQTSELMYWHDPLASNRKKLKKDIQAAMIQLCADPKPPVLESLNQTIKLWVQKSDGESEMPVRVKMRQQLKTCVAIATLTSSFFPSPPGYTLNGLVYEVELVQGREMTQMNSRDPYISVIVQNVLAPASPPPQCYVFDGLDWIPVDLPSSYNADKNEMECKTRQLGFLIITSRQKPASTPAASTTITTSMATPSAKVTTEAQTAATTVATTTEKIAVTTTERVTTTTTPMPTTTSSSASAVTQVASWTTKGVLEDDDDKGSSKETPVAYMGAQFRIEENFDEFVTEEDTDGLRLLLTQQLATIFAVDPTFIFITLSKGSIVVTMYMLVGMEDDRYRVLEDLTGRLRSGQLTLYANGRQLSVPQQDVTLVQTSPPSQKAAQYGTGGVGILACVIIMWLACRSRRTSANASTSDSDDDSSLPQYLTLENEPGLDGSQMSVMQYRRPCPLADDPLVKIHPSRP